MTGDETPTAGATDGRPRCHWAAAGSPPNRHYHDTEWGVPERDRARLFELLTLEGAQAGLSWSTILARRDGYRRVFGGFNAEVLAGWTDADVDRAVADAGIIRHRGKVASVAANAQAICELEAAGTTLDALVWSSVDGTPLQPAFVAGQVPAVTDVARALSRELKRRGFRFVGPTTLYAFMQAAGLTNDHTTDCFRWAELA